jgi:L-asparagine transporter-like permease
MAVRSAPGRLRRSPGTEGFKRDLRAPQLALLTVGGVMGSGLFLASGLAVRLAGPAALGVFALGSIAMYLEISALGEMAAADPRPGSFLVYAREVLGPGVTFVAGWIYWVSSVLTMSSEVTAAALFTQLWAPHVALWAFALAYSGLIVGLNFLSVRGFGTSEGVMAGIKTLAMLAFVAGGALLLGHVRAVVTLPGPGGWLPNGLRGVAPSLVLVLFAFAGTGVIGMAAAESADPTRTIRGAVRTTSLAIPALYLGAIWLLLRLVPWRRMPTTSSPFVAALGALGLPRLASVLNLVLLFAVLSTMNAALYANVRVLYSLARQGEAPAGLGRLNARGVPVTATWTSAGLLALTLLLAYFLPHRAYAYLVTATGFQAMFIWLVILVTHLRYRRHLLRTHPERLSWRLWGYPYTTWLVILIVLAALAGAPVARGEAVGALIGLGAILAMAAEAVDRGRAPVDVGGAGVSRGRQLARRGAGHAVHRPPGDRGESARACQAGQRGGGAGVERRDDGVRLRLHLVDARPAAVAAQKGAVVCQRGVDADQRGVDLRQERLRAAVDHGPGEGGMLVRPPPGGVEQAHARRPLRDGVEQALRVGGRVGVVVELDFGVEDIERLPAVLHGRGNQLREGGAVGGVCVPPRDAGEPGGGAGRRQLAELPLPGLTAAVGGRGRGAVVVLDQDAAQPRGLRQRDGRLRRAVEHGAQVVDPAVLTGGQHGRVEGHGAYLRWSTPYGSRPAAVPRRDRRAPSGGAAWT